MNKFKIGEQQYRTRALEQTIRKMSEENAMLKSEEKYAKLDKEWQIRFDKYSQGECILICVNRGGGGII